MNFEKQVKKYIRKFIRLIAIKARNVVYKVILLLNPGFELQLRFLPVSRINRMIYIDSRNINHYVNKNHINWEHVNKYFNYDGDWDLMKINVIPINEEP